MTDLKARKRGLSGSFSHSVLKNQNKPNQNAEGFFSFGVLARKDLVYTLDVLQVEDQLKSCMASVSSVLLCLMCADKISLLACSIVMGHNLIWGYPTHTALRLFLFSFPSSSVFLLLRLFSLSLPLFLRLSVSLVRSFAPASSLTFASAHRLRGIRGWWFFFPSLQCNSLSVSTLFTTRSCCT